MIKAIMIIVSTLCGMYLFDRFMLLLEEHNWIYWRKKKPDFRGGIGKALQELSSMLAPASRYTIEAKQTRTKKSDQSDDDR